MPRYLKQNGATATATDPDRQVWYAADWKCGFWTDDWSLLRTVGTGIPCCPVCACVGCQTSAKKWDDSVTCYDVGNPGYAAGVAARKGKCKRSQLSSLTSFLRPGS